MIKQIIKQLKNKQNLILSGGAGAGKTYTLQRLLECDELGKIQVLAPTAIAAVASGGRTIHSFFGFRLAKNLSALRMKNAERAELLKNLSELDLLIIDEISMLSAALFDMIDHFLSALKTPPTLLLVGDFYQLAPISTDKSEYAFCSPNWGKYRFKLLELRSQHRMKDASFFAALSKLRTGNTDAECAQFFARFITRRALSEFSDFTIICGTNKEALAINAERLAALPGRAQHAEAELFAAPDAPAINPQQFSKMLARTPLDESFAFKPGARVIVTMNQPSCKLYNGMQAIIESAELASETITLRTESGELIKARPCTFSFDARGESCDGEGAEPSYVISGFALKLAYAITIHKSQGMSIEKLVCKCDHIFAAGQLYVALSRASNPASFFISFMGNEAAFARMLAAKSATDAKVAAFYANAPRAEIEQN